MSKSKLQANYEKSLALENQRAEPTAEATMQITSKATQASRQKKKGVVAYVHPGAAKQLKLLSTETEKTQQDLLIEALNLLFEKYYKQPIA